MHHICGFETGKFGSDPLRSMIWIKTHTFEGWGCSKCIWVFHPSGFPVGKSLEQMKQNFQIQLADAFASHPCAEPNRAKAAEVSS
jgi:hypothetical protein